MKSSADGDYHVWKNLDLLVLVHCLLSHIGYRPISSFREITSRNSLTSEMWKCFRKFFRGDNLDTRCPLSESLSCFRTEHMRMETCFLCTYQQSRLVEISCSGHSRVGCGAHRPPALATIFVTRWALDAVLYDRDRRPLYGKRNKLSAWLF